MPYRLSELLVDGMPCLPSPAPVARRQGWSDAARGQMAQEQAVPADVACELHRRPPKRSLAGRILDFGNARSGYRCTQVLQGYLHLRACHLLRTWQFAMQVQQAGLVQVGRLADVHFPVPPAAALLARNEESLS